MSTVKDSLVRLYAGPGCEGMRVLSHGGRLSPETLLWKDGFTAPFMDNQMEKGSNMK